VSFEAELIAWVGQVLNLDLSDCHVDAIVKGGSDRQYLRLKHLALPKSSVIVMIYTTQRSDNLKYEVTTNLLLKAGVRVPSIYFHDRASMRMILEDVGGLDLYEVSQRGQDEIMDRSYRQALTEIYKCHQNLEKNHSPDDLKELEKGFDEKLYQWEQDYFFEHLIQGYYQFDLNTEDIQGVQEELKRGVHQLVKWDRCLVHRDFQSQNIMMAANGVVLIDHQGLRLGLAGYDLASLLYDPYVQLNEQQRQSYFEFYLSLCDQEAKKLLMETFEWCVIQRLMQALGAYGNLGLKLGKPHFLKFIPFALNRLKEVVSQKEELKNFAAFLTKLLQKKP
jgi:N-acetylmuramate 1-kinase